jgi:hypothetical protein
MKGYDIREIVPLTPGSGPLLISEIDSFNNIKISPRLQSIVAMDYFHFVKLNLSKKCHLWPSDDRCSERYVLMRCDGAMRNSGVNVCTGIAASPSARIHPNRSLMTMKLSRVRFPSHMIALHAP